MSSFGFETGRNKRTNERTNGIFENNTVKFFGYRDLLWRLAADKNNYARWELTGGQLLYFYPKKVAAAL